MIEEVHVPPKITNIDPKAQPKPSSYWEEQAFEARKRREYVQEQKMTEELMKEPAPPPAPEAPFKVTGGINLGNIDIQENMRRSEEKAEAERKEVQRIREENMQIREQEKAEQKKLLDEERARREMAEERARQLEIVQLKEQISQQMTNLEKMVAQGTRQPKSFVEQYDEVMALSNKLGLAEKTSTDDPQVRLSIMKMQADMAREEREFKRTWRNDDKKWQLELAKLELEKKNHGELIEHEKSRNEMFANAFKNVGAAIATGLQSSGEEEAAAVAGARPPSARTAAPRKSKIQAEVGSAGEVECPECHSPVGIGPNTTRAACAGCGFLFEIERFRPQPPPPAHAPPPVPPAAPADEMGLDMEIEEGDQPNGRV